jgi:hypothetical protein
MDGADCSAFMFLYLPLFHYVGSVQHIFHHVEIKVIIFTTGRLTSTHLKTVVVANMTANAGGNKSLTCLPKLGGARDNTITNDIVLSRDNTITNDIVLSRD